MVEPNEIPVTLLEGSVQNCHGYLERKSRILKRWKKRWFVITPGETMLAVFP